MTTKRCPIKSWRGLETAELRRLSGAWWIGGMLLVYAGATGVFFGIGCALIFDPSWAWPASFVAGLVGLAWGAAMLIAHSAAVTELQNRHDRRVLRLVKD